MLFENIETVELNYVQGSRVRYNTGRTARDLYTGDNILITFPFNLLNASLRYLAGRLLNTSRCSASAGGRLRNDKLPKRNLQI